MSSILSVLFDKMSSNVSGQTSVNPLGYITEMTSVNPLTALTPTEGDVQDFKKARLSASRKVITSARFSTLAAFLRFLQLDIHRAFFCTVAFDIRAHGRHFVKLICIFTRFAFRA